MIASPCRAATCAIAVMSAGCPYRCTGMMAAVRGVTAAAAAFGSRVRRSASISANTGRAPVIMIASAEYAADNGAVITSSPRPMPSARSAIASASVPVPTPTAADAPEAPANSCSKASSSGPSTNHPRAITRSMAARITGASSPGVSCRNGITGMDDANRSCVVRRVRRQGVWPRNPRRPLTQVFFPDHKRNPQRCHVDCRLEQTPKIEELRLAIHTMIVVYRYFGDAEPGVLDLLHHLQADDAAARF